MSEEQPATAWDTWSLRLRAVRRTVVTLSNETRARPLARDLSDLDREPDLDLAAGTAVRYEDTRYDSMRLDFAFHLVKVVSGAAAGRWASIGDTVGPGRLPWE